MGNNNTEGRVINKFTDSSIFRYLYLLELPYGVDSTGKSEVEEWVPKLKVTELLECTGRFW